VLIDLWENQHHDIKICGGICHLLDEKDISKLTKSDRWHFGCTDIKQLENSVVEDPKSRNSDDDDDDDLFVNTNHHRIADNAASDSGNESE